jgi:hypothetical protein
LYREKKDQVLITPPESLDIQKEVLEVILSHLKQFYPDLYSVNNHCVEVFKNDEVLDFSDFQNPIELASLLVQEDLVIMKPDQDIFYLEAASLCAPTRWSLKEKFRQSLSAIHKEVPGYQEKIDSRVSNIFKNLPSKKIFERFNWSIFDSPELFQPISNKSRVEITNIDPEKLFLRVERQTIRRLENSQCILFMVRVHVDHISAILNSQRAILDLVKALENLEDDMKVYKVIKPFEENLLNWLKSKTSQ